MGAPRVWLVAVSVCLALHLGSASSRNLGVAQQVRDRMCGGCTPKTKTNRHTYNSLTCASKVEDHLLTKTAGASAALFYCCNTALPSNWKIGSTDAAIDKAYASLAKDYGCSDMNTIVLSDDKHGSLQTNQGVLSCEPKQLIFMCMDV